MSDEGLQRLGARFSSAVEQNRSAGAVVLVARTGQPAYFEALGFRDRSRGLSMHRDCVFRIASMTKPVVAAAALLLLEEGRLALIDPIQEYLPKFRNMTVGTHIVEPDGRASLSLAPALRPITVHDLFRHTSGLTTGMFGGSLIGRQYVESRLRDDQQTLAQMISRLAQIPLLHQPGTTFEYGMSTDVLGRIVEVVSGVDLNRFIIDRISRPLGLADTAFVLDARSDDRLALPHTDGTATAQILPAYVHHALAAPDELTTEANITLAPPAPFIPPAWHGRPVLAIMPCYTGDLAEGECVMAPLRRHLEEISSEPLSAALLRPKRHSFFQVMREFAKAWV